jgi:hypothetical protein
VNRWKVSGVHYWSVIEEVCIYIQEFDLDILKGSETFLDFDTYYPAIGFCITCHSRDAQMPPYSSTADLARK